jgi:Recombination endonuclease VII
MENTKAREKRLMDSFKLTISLWDRIEAFQKGRCAMCGRKERRMNQRLATDHEHFGKGTVRGLLCSQCNPLLGKLENAFIRLGMHKEEGVTLLGIVAQLHNYLQYPPATQALGYEHHGYPHRVGTKKHRAMLKRLARIKGEEK